VIDNAVDRQVQAYNDRDLEAFLACYAGEVIIRDGSGRVHLRGHGQLRDTYGQQFGSVAIRLQVAERLEGGRWIVQNERLSTPDGVVQTLVAYELDAVGLIRTVVVLTDSGD